MAFIKSKQKFLLNEVNVSKSKDNELLNEINNIEIQLKSIQECKSIINKYKYIETDIMNVLDKTSKFEYLLEINPLMIHETINNGELLIKNEFFKKHIHHLYSNMITNYINKSYNQSFDEAYISTTAKIYKIYIFRINTEKKLNTFKNVNELNKELEELLLKHIVLIT